MNTQASRFAVANGLTRLNSTMNPRRDKAPGVTMGAKWLQLLKEIAPQTKHVVALRYQGMAAHDGLWSTIEGAAPSFAVKIRSVLFAGLPTLRKPFLRRLAKRTVV